MGRFVSFSKIAAAVNLCALALTACKVDTTAKKPYAEWAMADGCDPDCAGDINQRIYSVAEAKQVVKEGAPCLCGGAKAEPLDKIPIAFDCRGKEKRWGYILLVKCAQPFKPSYAEDKTDIHGLVVKLRSEKEMDNCNEQPASAK